MYYGLLFKVRKMYDNLLVFFNKVSNNSLCIDWNKINAEAKSALFSIGWLSGCGSLEVEKKNILACVNKEYWNNGCHLEDFLIDIYDETGNL